MAVHTAKVSIKGQIVIPNDLQERLDLPDGALLEIQIDDSTATLEKTRGWVERTRGALATGHPQIEPEQLELLVEATAIIEALEKYREPR